MNTEPSSDIAKNYYDSTDADNFYFHIWGGEDIHIGLYNGADEPIKDASRRTVEKMASRLGEPSSGKVLADLGSGFGGAARYLAKTMNFDIKCINISPVENQRNRSMNQEAGLGEKIEVLDGSFEQIPLPDSSCDFAWSQDAILHSGNRKKVLEEVKRILKSGGEFIFTDPMQKDGIDKESIRPVLDRIHLDSMGSFEFYSNTARDLGLEVVAIEDLSQYLPMHYNRVHEELEKNHDSIAAHCSLPYLEKMKTGLMHWVEAGNQGKLTWGIIHLKKK